MSAREYGETIEMEPRVNPTRIDLRQNVSVLRLEEVRQVSKADLRTLDLVRIKGVADA